MKFCAIFLILLMNGCLPSFSINGGPPPDYPYYITTKPMVVKKILLPAGTKLIYELQSSKEGKQDKQLDEKTLKDIKLQDSATIDWAGIPVNEISRFFNSEMSGFSVYADFSKLDDKKKSKFSEMWKGCNDDLGIMVKDLNDWSFNTKNITDIQSCSVNYQRYFKDDDRQQKFLDSLYTEMLNQNVSQNSKNKN